MDSYCKRNNLSTSLRTRIDRWLEHMWSARREREETLALSSLPPTLRRSLLVHTRLPAIQKVQLFNQLDSSFLSCILPQFQKVEFLAQEFVCKKGTRD